MGRNRVSGNEEENERSDREKHIHREGMERTAGVGEILLGGRLRCFHPWIAAEPSGKGVGGDSACQSSCQNEHGFPLPCLHRTVPYFPPSFSQFSANLICDVCEDEAA